MKGSKQHGMVLVVVLLWLTMITVLVITSLTRAHWQRRVMNLMEERVQAQALAELGLQAARAELLHEAFSMHLQGAKVRWSIEIINANLDADKTYLLTSNVSYRHARAAMTEAVVLIQPKCVVEKPCNKATLERLWWKEH